MVYNVCKKKGNLRLSPQSEAMHWVKNLFPQESFPKVGAIAAGKKGVPLLRERKEGRSDGEGRSTRGFHS